MVRDEQIHFCEGGQCRFCIVRNKKKYFVSTDFSLAISLQARLTQHTSDVSKPQKDSKATVFLAPPNLVYIGFPYTPMTLEGSGTISQLRQCRSHAPSKATPSLMSAKLRDNQLSIYSILFEDVWWSLNETTVCCQRVEWSTRESLNCWLSSGRGNAVSTLELCDKTLSYCVQAYWWLPVARLWKILQQHWPKRQCSFPFSSWLRNLYCKLCIRLLKNIHAKGFQQVSSLRRTHGNIKWQRNISQFTSFLQR